MGDLLIVWLGIGRDWHFAMENITTGAEILPQPDHSLQIVNVEHTAYGNSWSRSARIFLSPPLNVRNRFALVSAEDIHFVHAWSRGFDPDNMLAFE